MSNYWNKVYLIPLLMLIPLSANASLVTCSTDVADDVTGTSACQISSESQDFLQEPFTVNNEGFFGISDWMFAGRENLGEGYDSGDVDIGFGITGTMLEGMWSISSSAWDSWDNIMLVFKSGNERSDTTLVGYLLDGESTDGVWESPYHLPDFDLNEGQTKEVSHISAYVSGTEHRIPEPASAALLGLGLMLIVWAKGLRLYAHV
jgi:hypothetical protein